MRSLARGLSIALTITFSFAGCSESLHDGNSYILRLKNRGVVPLSSENPFIAANAMINKEMERSPELKGFITHIGAPGAIRVDQGLFSPLYIEFYYPGKGEYYTAEDNAGIWLINGPFQMNAAMQDEIKRVLIIKAEEGKIILPQAPKEPVPELIPPTPKPSSLPPPGVTPKAPPTPALRPKSEPSTESHETAAPDAEMPTAVIQQITGQYGKAPAETTPKGDIVHYVSLPGETVAMLARWYTHDVGNQQRILRINHQIIANGLSLGDSVVIPGYLVKNKFMLTQEALAALEQAVAKGSVR